MSGNLYIVTVKLDKDPAARPHALSCRHNRSNNKVLAGMFYGHCGEMGCPNYLSTCRRHRLTGSEQEACSRDKKTGPCPVLLNETCTDASGEHHTVLVEAEDAETVRRVIKERGYDHITRIERGWILKVG